MTVRAILSTKGRDVVSIEPTATVEAAAKLLTERDIGSLLVFGPDRRLAGILSERDLVEALARTGPSMLSKPVSQLMTREVVTCTESETVVAMMERMTTGKFRHLPVVGERNEVAGVISIGDVVKHRLSEMENESAALRDYIQTA
jgi:CBS domain-containing protein